MCYTDRQRRPEGCEVLSEAPDLHSPEKLRADFAAHGQEPVFRFWDTLDAESRRGLIRQLAGFDLPALMRGFARARAVGAAPQRIEPVPVEVAPESGGSQAAFQKAREAGETLLEAGRVGVMVVA